MTGLYVTAGRRGRIPAYRFLISLLLLIAALPAASQGFLSRVDLRVNSADQNSPHVATDGKGRWVVVWKSNENFLSVNGLLGLDDDILSSRSSDGGATWSSPAVVNVNDGAFDDLLSLAPEDHPRCAADGLGNWIAVWDSTSPVLDLGKGILGPPEQDIHFSISNDDGVTWNGPFNLEDETGGALNTHGVSDSHPQILYDGEGTWLLVWSAKDGDLELTNSDSDLFFIRSTNTGVLWDTFGVLNMTAFGDSGDDTRPAMATDGAGTVITVWESSVESIADQPNGFDVDILASVSNDFGATWSLPWLVSSTSANDGNDEALPAIATDSKGNWIVAWESTSNANSAGIDTDIRCATSADNGLTWSTPTLVNNNAATDGAATDTHPTLATDGFGTWICLWSTTADIGGSGGDADVVYALSFDNGQSWTDPALADSAATGLEGTPFDESPVVSADRAGQWLAAWTKGALVNLAVQPGIVGASGIFTGSIEGHINNGPYSLGCAAVVATSLDSDVERRAVADSNGDYRLENLPVGTYRVTAYAPGFASVATDVVVTGGVDLEHNIAMLLSPLTGGVFGSVVDMDTGQPPLVSVRVEAYVAGELAGVTYTCGSGDYELRLDPLKGESLSVTLSFVQESYEHEEVPVTVTPPANVEVNVTMEKAINAPATLAGIVRSSTTSLPINGARVTLSGRANVSTRCDQNGIYIFDAIPEGVYTVRASAVQFVGATQTVAASYIPSELSFLLDDDPSGPPNRADVNGDASVNAVDIQLVINGVLGLPTGYLADLNGDSNVDAADVQMAINAVLGG